MTERNARGQFTTGNSVARNKRGYKDRGRQLARLFSDADIQLVYRTLMVKAEQGDVAALSLISRYIAPPPKPTLDPTPFPFDRTDPLSSALSILDATAAGQLPADVARTLMDAVTGLQRIREVVELESRIRTIEAELEKPA